MNNGDASPISKGPWQQQTIQHLQATACRVDHGCLLFLTMTMEMGRVTNHNHGSMTVNNTPSVPSLMSNCLWGGSQVEQQQQQQQQQQQMAAGATAWCCDDGVAWVTMTEGDLWWETTGEGHHQQGWTMTSGGEDDEELVEWQKAGRETGMMTTGETPVAPSWIWGFILN